MSLIKKSILIFFSFTIIFLIKAETSFANQKVSEIRIEGNLRVDRETILAFISLTEGSEYNSEDINLTLKELYKTGFFENVEVTDKNNIVTIIVNENSILNLIGFEGNKRFDDEILSEIIKLKKNQIFSKKIVSDAVSKIIELYKTQGRFGTTIIPQIVMLEGKRVDLVFEIEEGPLLSLIHI